MGPSSGLHRLAPLVGDAHVEGGAFLPGERVHVATASLDGFRDRGCVALLGAFEEEVLEEVADARSRRGLVP